MCVKCTRSRSLKDVWFVVTVCVKGPEKLFWCWWFKCVAPLQLKWVGLISQQLQDLKVMRLIIQMKNPCWIGSATGQSRANVQ